MRYADRILAIRDARMAPEPKEVHICSECLKGIYPGDRFYESCGSYVCEECLKGMTIDEIFELLGENLEKA